MKPLILLTLTFSILFGAVAPVPALAQQGAVSDSFYEDGSPTVTDGAITSGGFVPCSGTQCSLCDFAVMANTIIKWLIGIIFLFFAILAVYAGFKLVTSGSNQSTRQAAKSSFTNAFIGLFIVLGAWILIDTLLRALLAGGTGEITGFGPWSEVQCASQVSSTIQDLAIGDPAFDPGAPPPPTVTTGGGSFTPASGCTGGSCVPLTIPCSARGCSISSDMASRLAGMHAQAGVSGARVTEAMPPSRTHKSTCHTNGTCIDYSKAGGMTGSEVASVIRAAYANGLRPVYEVQTQAQKNALVAAGAPAANIKVLGSWISAPHFSIYGY